MVQSEHELKKIKQAPTTTSVLKKKYVPPTLAMLIEIEPESGTVQHLNENTTAVSARGEISTS